MCGITGFWTARSSSDDERVLRAMSAALEHRGPDDSGHWSDADAGVFLGHRRLSIIDVSAAGHQPMRSADGRYLLVYNGEVYNHTAIRARIERERGPRAWRGTSDTETLLASIETWGFPGCLAHWNGMFAIALWDRERRTLSFARDRLGEKPLYYGVNNGVLLFGSELTALRRHPAFDGGIDRDAVADFLRYSVVPAPKSIHIGIHKLSPGSWVTFTSPDATPSQARYWDLRRIAVEGQAAAVGEVRDAASGSAGGAGDGAADWDERLSRQLAASVSSRMLADVPLGAFLSGGIDSSLIVALMQRASARPVRTFSIGFDEPAFDEAPHARRVAEHLGTDHTELYVSAGEALALVPSLGQLWSEPFADPSQIPTFLVSRMAREAVTVALSGDGGDELFGGYRRYDDAPRIWRSLRRMPRPLRAAAAHVIRRHGAALGTAVARGGRSGAFLNRYLATAEHVAPLLSSESEHALYLRMRTLWADAERMAGASAPGDARAFDEASLPTGLDRMMLHDCLTYLPDTILTKVDRAGMAASLETRAPLLDHELVELAWSIPAAVRKRGGVGKVPLRAELFRHLPRSLVERPKMGFGVPIGAWLRGPLRDWGESHLSESALRRHGLLAPEVIRRRWAEHLAGTHDWKYPLWNVLMFQNWYAANVDGR